MEKYKKDVKQTNKIGILLEKMNVVKPVKCSSTSHVFSQISSGVTKRLILGHNHMDVCKRHRLRQRPVDVWDGFDESCLRWLAKSCSKLVGGLKLLEFSWFQRKICKV
jgi:hypothetical protein